MKSNEIIEKQTKYLIPSSEAGRIPLVIVKGKGAIVEDNEGRKYIDCHGGYSSVNIGHCHPRVVKSIREQVGKIWHVSWDYYLESTSLLGEKLAEISPGNLEKTLFCSCGAEAVENAVKIAKKYAFKNFGRSGAQIVSLSGSFHGRTSYAMALTGQNKYKTGLSSYVHPGVVIAPAPYCYRCFYGLSYPECDLHCAKSMESLIKYETVGDIAAFISEPILGEGGIIVPPDEFLGEVVKIFREHDALYIADEIQTGFGRTGKHFGVEWFNVKPDIMTLAKGIASGLPIAAMMATDKVASAFGPMDHCSTYGGNAVVCNAALENINVLLEEKLTEKAHKLGVILMDELKRLSEKYGIIGDVRGKGLMIGMELVKNSKTKTPAIEEASKVREYMAKRNVLVNVGGVFGNVLRLQPPFAITEEQIKVVLDNLDLSFKAIG